MTIWEYISLRKFVSIKTYNDWIINCDLTNVSPLYKYINIIVFRWFNVRRGFQEIHFLPKFQKKEF